MKKFRLFVYEDRCERSGNYIGKTEEKIVYAENSQEIEKNIWDKYPWAMGYFCQEIE